MHIRRHSRSVLFAALVILPITVGCGGGDTGPSTGLRITVATTGSEPDADGYAITVDGNTAGTVASNGNAVVTASSGSHSVDLSGIAGNCELSGEHPQSVTVVDGEVSQVAFAVTCVQSGAGAVSMFAGPAVVAMVPGQDTVIEVALYDPQGHLVPVASRRLFQYTNNAPNLVTVSDTGEIRVAQSATPGQTAIIEVSFDTLSTLVQINVATPGAAVVVRPSPIGLTPGGMHVLEGLVQLSSGDSVPGYLIGFALPPNAAAHLTKSGCGPVDCTAASPWEALLFADAPGTATITVDGGGRQTTVPVTVAYADFASVTAGAEHTCGMTTTGALYCWGGLLGRTPLAEHRLDGLSDIQAFVNRTCGLDAAGTTVCLGDTLSAVTTSTPSSVPFTALALGDAFTCGLDSGGAAWCWGDNQHGELGDGTQTPSTVPVAVAGGHSFTALTAAATHACGLTAAGEAWCWGFNLAGELGVHLVPPPDPCLPYECSLVPVQVQDGHQFTSLVAGANHTCGLDTNGAAWCWGYGGRLGAGPPTDIYNAVPEAVLGGLVFGSLTATGIHTCGLTLDGQAYCWGGNPDGRTGQPPTDSPLVPTVVSGGHVFSQLSAGGTQTCGIASDGLYCWGGNSSGQIGVVSGSTEAPVKPVGQP